VRNVLAHLGLDVNRLIRVSYGPFQLGDLDEGAVDEVPSRVLREQLGEKLVALSGADFASEKAPRPAKAGAASDKAEDGARKTRAGLIADRKGRRVLVQRTEKPKREDEDNWRPPSGPRRARPYHGKADRSDARSGQGTGKRPGPKPGGKAPPRGRS